MHNTISQGGLPNERARSNYSSVARDLSLLICPEAWSVSDKVEHVPPSLPSLCVSQMVHNGAWLNVTLSNVLPMCHRLSGSVRTSAYAVDKISQRIVAGTQAQTAIGSVHWIRISHEMLDYRSSAWRSVAAPLLHAPQQAILTAMRLQRRGSCQLGSWRRWPCALSRS